MDDTTKETILTYEGIAEYYATVRDDPALRSQCRDLLGTPKRGSRVLEIGCGPGLDAAALVRKGFEVVAIDLCDAFIERGKLYHPEVEFHRMDLRAPEFDDASFDGILGMASLVHVIPEDLDSTLKHYRRLLKPGGKLVLWMCDSPRVSSYDVPDWGGASTRVLRMWCHDRAVMARSIRSAGFDEPRLLQVHSDYYAKMRRIQENEVSLYVVVAQVAGS